MDELLVMMRQVMERLDKIETSIDELRAEQRPLSSRDYIHSLQQEKGMDLDEWLKSVDISVKSIRVILEERSYQVLLENLNLDNAMRIFDSKKNTVYCFIDGKWKTMTKQLVEKVQKGLFNKVHKKYCAMRKEPSSELNRTSIKEMSYIEQRGILNSIEDAHTTKFKGDLWNALKSCKAA